MDRRRLVPLLLLLALLAARSASALTIVITSDKANVMAGPKVVAIVSKGQAFFVEKVADDKLWYQVRVRVGDEVYVGWIHSRDCEEQKKATTGIDPREAEAEKEFERLKPQTDKLAKEGKIQEALDLLDKFGEKYAGTKAAKAAVRYGAELDKSTSANPENLEAEAEREFNKRKEEADKLVEGGRVADALRVIEGFPNKYEKTKWAAEAQKLAQDLTAKAGEKEFAARKAEADKLAAEGKLEEAIKAIDRFLAHYEATKWGTDAKNYRLELVKRARAPLADFEKKLFALVQEGKFDDALAEVKAAQEKAPADKAEYFKFTKDFVELRKRAAATPDAPISSDGSIADVYAKDAAADSDFVKQISRLLQFVGPEGMSEVKVQYGPQLVTFRIPKPADQIATGEQLITTYPWSPNIRMALARIYARTGEADKAAAKYAEARALDGGITVTTLDAAIESCRVLTRAKRGADAVAAVGKALERKADDFIALAALGRAHAAAGDKAQAIAAWEKSLKTNPSQPAVARLLAEAKGEKVADEAPAKLALPDLVKQVQESCLVVAATNSSGSGFVVSSDGLVSTNFHVIAPGGKLQLRYKHNDETVNIADVDLVLADPARDIALLRFDARAFPLRPLPLGSTKDISSGEDVVIIGNPGMMGRILDYTITRGIVSNRDREINGVHYFQTDAAVNPGNSGGPMFNMRGQVIGMVTLKIMVMERAGFALHIDQVRDHLPHCFPEIE